jgi:hypothetical protein
MLLWQSQGGCESVYLQTVFTCEERKMIASFSTCLPKQYKHIRRKQ